MKERFLQNDNYFDDSQLLLRAFRHIQVPTDLHRQEFAEVVFVMGGWGLYGSGRGTPVEISHGDILIVPPGGKHIYLEAEELDIVCLLFAKLPIPLLDLQNLPAFRELFGRPEEYYENHNREYPVIHPDGEVFRRLEGLLDAFLFVQQLGNGCAKLGVFMSITGIICSCAAVESSTGIKEVPWDMHQISTFISNNCHRNLSLEELAKKCSMSVSSLLRAFKKTFGTTPANYITCKRLEYAAMLLGNTSLRITEIADRCGFSTAAYFIARFKKKYGSAPGVFRKKL